MQKRILPTMIGALLMGGVGIAAADVTLFGHIDTSVDATDVDGGDDDINLNCTTCSVGFKGSEDLGNGLKAIFSIDFQYDTTERNNSRPSTTKISLTPSSPLGSYLGLTTTTTVSLVTGVGTSAITDRDQWLGLAGNFGKVRIGTISTGYKSHGAMLDPFYRTSLEGRAHGLQTSRFHSGAGENLQGRATNTVRWDSPDFSGFNVVAHYTFDSDDARDGNDPYGIGASYENGGLLVFADYLDNNGSAGDADGEVDAMKVGGKFGMDNWAIMAQYETTESNNVDDDVWHVGGSMTFGANMIYAAYGNEEKGSNYDVDAFTIAAMHSMSKSTKVYIGYNNQDGDGSSVGSSVDVDQFSIGMKHKF
jgi:predicted porin